MFPIASCVISSSRALSGCISLAQHKELRDVKLDGVRMLLMDDGANPCKYYASIIFDDTFLVGSLASSDLFFDAYSPKGLNREALCPCAGSPETLTLSVRRSVFSFLLVDLSLWCYD